MTVLSLRAKQVLRFALDDSLWILDDSLWILDDSLWIWT
jgi:hypothetical protein